MCRCILTSYYCTATHRLVDGYLLCFLRYESVFNTISRSAVTNRVTLFSSERRYYVICVSRTVAG